MTDMRTRKRSYLYAVSAALSLLLLLTLLPLGNLLAQNQQSIPDAPSSTRPFPKPQVSPTSRPAAPEAQAPQAHPPDTTDANGNQQAPAPPPNITTVPEGGATKVENTNSRDELFTVIKSVNFVQVPV